MLLSRSPDKFRLPEFDDKDDCEQVIKCILNSVFSCLEQYRERKKRKAQSIHPSEFRTKRIKTDNDDQKIRKSKSKESDDLKTRRPKSKESGYQQKRVPKSREREYQESRGAKSKKPDDLQRRVSKSTNFCEWIFGKPFRITMTDSHSSSKKLSSESDKKTDRKKLKKDALKTTRKDIQRDESIESFTKRKTPIKFLPSHQRLGKNHISQPIDKRKIVQRSPVEDPKKGPLLSKHPLSEEMKKKKISESKSTERKGDRTSSDAEKRLELKSKSSSKESKKISSILEKSKLPSKSTPRKYQLLRKQIDKNKMGNFCAWLFDHVSKDKPFKVKKTERNRLEYLSPEKKDKLRKDRRKDAQNIPDMISRKRKHPNSGKSTSQTSDSLSTKQRRIRSSSKLRASKISDKKKSVRGRQSEVKDTPKFDSIKSQEKDKKNIWKFCDWILGKPISISPEIKKDFRRFKTINGRPIDKFERRPLKEEPGKPGIYRTSSGSKIDKQGRQIEISRTKNRSTNKFDRPLTEEPGKPRVFRTPTGSKIVRPLHHEPHKDVIISNDGRPTDKFGKSLKEESGKPGVFRTSSGSKIDRDGYLIEQKPSRRINRQLPSEPHKDVIISRDGKPADKFGRPPREEPSQPGLFRTSSGTKVNKDDLLIDKRPRAQGKRTSPSSFCKWLIGDTQYIKFTKAKDTRAKDNDGQLIDRQPEGSIDRPLLGKPPKGVIISSDERPTDKFGKPLKEEPRQPGLFRTPSGSKVNKDGHFIDRSPATKTGRFLPGKSRKDIIIGHDGRPADKFGRPLRELPGKPGVFRTLSGSEIDKNGRVIDRHSRSRSDRQLPGKLQKDVTISPNGRPTDKFGKPLTEERSQPGVFEAPSGSKVNKDGQILSPDSQAKIFKRKETSPNSFCKWLIGDTQSINFTKAKNARAKDKDGDVIDRQPTRSIDRQLSGEPHKDVIISRDGRPTDKFERPLKAEPHKPGIFRTPSGSKVNEDGHLVSRRPATRTDRVLSGKPRKDVIITPDGRPADKFGKPLKEDSRQPGVFRTPSGTKVNKDGHLISRSPATRTDRLLPGKPHKDVIISRDGKPADKFGRPLREEPSQPGVFRTTSGSKIDKDGHLIARKPEGKIERTLPRKPHKNIIITRDRKPADKFGRPLREKTSQPGVFRTSSGTKVNEVGRKRQFDSQEKIKRNETSPSSFCKWLIGNTESIKLTKAKDARAKDNDGHLIDRQSTGSIDRPLLEKPHKGVIISSDGRPTDKFGKPLKEDSRQPGVFRTPSGTKVNKDGHLISRSPATRTDRLLPGKPHKDVIISRDGKPADKFGRPLREEPSQPGVFRTSSGTKVNEVGRKLEFDSQEKIKRNETSPSSFCKWLIGNTESIKLTKAKDARAKDNDGHLIDRQSTGSIDRPLLEKPHKGVIISSDGRPTDKFGKPLKEDSGQPGVFRTPSGSKIDKDGYVIDRQPIDKISRPLSDEPHKGVTVSREGRPADTFGRPLREEPSQPGLFRTPSGSNIDKDRDLIDRKPRGKIDRPLRGEPHKDVIITRDRRPADKFGRPLREEPNQPGVFRTFSTSKVDKDGHLISKRPRTQQGPFDKPLSNENYSSPKHYPEKQSSDLQIEHKRKLPFGSQEKIFKRRRTSPGSFCKWLIGDTQSNKSPKIKDAKRRYVKSLEDSSKPYSSKVSKDNDVTSVKERVKPYSEDDKKKIDEIVKDYPSRDEQFEADCESFIACVQNCIRKHMATKRRRKNK